MSPPAGAGRAEGIRHGGGRGLCKEGGSSHWTLCHQGGGEGWVTSGLMAAVAGQGMALQLVLDELEVIPPQELTLPQ